MFFRTTADISLNRFQQKDILTPELIINLCRIIFPNHQKILCGDYITRLVNLRKVNFVRSYQEKFWILLLISVSVHRLSENILHLNFPVKTKNSFFIPPGFAHGFSVLSEEAIFSYKCSAYYSKENERCIIYNDENLNIDWQVDKPTVSQKDLLGKKFKEIEKDFIY